MCSRRWFPTGLEAWCSLRGQQLISRPSLDRQPREESLNCHPAPPRLWLLAALPVLHCSWVDAKAQCKLLLRRKTVEKR